MSQYSSSKALQSKSKSKSIYSDKCQNEEVLNQDIQILIKAVIK